MEFQSFLKGESAKRTMAWEVEKIELDRQHDFDLNIQRKDLENQLSMQKETRERTKLDTQMKALDDAAERGDISPEDARKEKLRLEIGVSGGQSGLFQKMSAEEKFYQDFLDKRKAEEATGGGVSPSQQRNPRTPRAVAQQNASRLLNFSKDLSIPKADREDMKRAYDEGNPTVIKSILDVIEAREHEPSEAKLFDIGASGLVPRRKFIKGPAFSPITGS